MYWLVGLAFILVSIAADAKQIIVAAVPAAIAVVMLADVAVMRAMSRLTRRRIKLGISLVAAGVFFAVVASYPPLLHASRGSELSGGASGKVDAARTIVDAMNSRPETFLTGLGSGNTVGKLATLTKGSGLKADSPVGALHLAESPVTAKIIAQDKSNYILASSSAFAGLSSLLGIFGDVGILGLTAYFMSWYGILRPGIRRGGAARTIIVAAIVSVLILGYINVWLEEPNFMLPLAAFLAAVAARTPAHGRSGTVGRVV